MNLLFSSNSLLVAVYKILTKVICLPKDQTPNWPLFFEREYSLSAVSDPGNVPILCVIVGSALY